MTARVVVGLARVGQFARTLDEFEARPKTARDNFRAVSLIKLNWRSLHDEPADSSAAREINGRAAARCALSLETEVKQTSTLIVSQPNRRAAAVWSFCSARVYQRVQPFRMIPITMHSNWWLFCSVCTSRNIRLMVACSKTGQAVRRGRVRFAHEPSRAEQGSARQTRPTQNYEGRSRFGTPSGK